MTKRYILVHYNGEIINTDEGVIFYNQNPQFMDVHLPIIFVELHNIILQRIGQQSNKQITQVFYRLPMVIEKVCSTTEVGSWVAMMMLDSCSLSTPNIRRFTLLSCSSF